MIRMCRAVFLFFSAIVFVAAFSAWSPSASATAAIPTTVLATNPLDHNAPWWTLYTGDDKCNKVKWDGDCFHYVTQYKTHAACFAAAEKRIGASEKVVGSSLHDCFVVQPTGYEDLYVWVDTCKYGLPYSEC